MNPEASSFYARLRGDAGQALERRNKFRPAIGISAVIDRVRPNKDIRSIEDFAPGKSIGKKDRVPRGHVGNRDVAVAFRPAILRHRNLIGQRGAAEDAQIDLRDAMFLGAQ